MGRLRFGLAQEGLHIVRPVSFTRLAESTLAADVQKRFPGAQGAVLVGDGGSDFFSRFESNGKTSGADPLDRYTVEVFTRVVEPVLAHAFVQWKIVYPFDSNAAPLPFHRLGLAAGLPAAGPLGLQVHPTFGPWWAYRGLILLDQPIAPSQSLSSSCSGCQAPCVGACPANAVLPSGLDVASCSANRQISPSCARACAARIACVVGREHAHPERQLAFHSAASLRLLRR